MSELETWAAGGGGGGGGGARQYKRLSRAFCLFFTFNFVFLAATFCASILIFAKE